MQYTARMNNLTTESIRFRTDEQYRGNLKQHLNQRIGNLIDPQDFAVEFDYLYTSSEHRLYHWRLHLLKPISIKRVELIRLAISEYL